MDNKGNGDKINRHVFFVAMSAIAMSFGDVYLTWQLSCHVISPVCGPFFIN